MIIKVAGIVSTLAVMAVLSGAAYAQTANSQSNSTSGAAANSGSQSGAAAVSRGGTADSRSSASQNFNNTSNTQTGVTLNQTSNTPDTQRVNTNNNYTGGTNNYDTSRQTGDVTIRTTPQVYAPPVSGGNPCTLAVSGGVSVIGWGAAAGGTFVDQDCANRQKIAMVHNAGYAKVAFEMMCNDRMTYDASKTAGTPCAYRPAFEAPGAPAQPMPMVQQQPTPIAPAPVVRTAAPREYPRCNPRAGIVDNCRS